MDKKISTLFAIIMILLIGGFLTFACIQIANKKESYSDIQNNLPIIKKDTVKSDKNINRETIGGQKDEHGCLIPAGYSWCEEKQKCLRVWEEKCSSLPEYGKIYSVDELVESKFQEGAFAKVKGTVGDCVDMKVSADYEGPGSGCALNGTNKSINVGNIAMGNGDQIIVVSGEIVYCGGKKIPKYICGLSDAKLEN